MIIWIFWVIVWIVTGAVVISGAVFGAAWFLAREINAGHEPNCSCPTCQARRLRQRQRERARQGQQDGLIPPANRPQAPYPTNVKPPDRSRWRSTLDLRPGMHVFSKDRGNVYEVIAVERRQYGYVVRLRHMLTGREALPHVRTERAHHRIWLIRPAKETRE